MIFFILLNESLQWSNSKSEVFFWKWKRFDRETKQKSAA